jgi:hypothetical protein
VCTEASTVLTAVAAIFSFTIAVWRSYQIAIFDTNQGVSTIMCKASNWKHSGISILEVEAVPHSCIL